MIKQGAEFRLWRREERLSWRWSDCSRRHGFYLRLDDTYVDHDLPVRPEEVCPVDEEEPGDEPKSEEVAQEHDEVENLQR